MKEIGGYLELERFADNEYYKDGIAFNTARNAFVFLVKSKNISKVYLPYYLCDSVYKVCERENIDYEFYHIDKDFMPLFEKPLNVSEYLYIVNFFGQISNEKVKCLKKKFKNIIFDNVQAFFDSPVAGVDTIYSCRKFFGVPDGAYLISDIEKDAKYETDVSFNRMKHLLGRFECKSATEYYEDFCLNDEMFEKLPVMYMSKLTHNILGAVDYDEVMKKRNNNWNVLNNELSKFNKLSLIKPDGPYMYPYYCKNGAEIRKKLISKKIFVPVLWPNVMKFKDCELEKDYADNILPLPIDQRYDESDMNAIINELKI